MHKVYEVLATVGLTGVEDFSKLEGWKEADYRRLSEKLLPVLLEAPETAAFAAHHDIGG